MKGCSDTRNPHSPSCFPMRARTLRFCGDPASRGMAISRKSSDAQLGGFGSVRRAGWPRREAPHECARVLGRKRRRAGAGPAPP